MAENFQSNFVFGLHGNLYQEFIDKVASSIIQEIIGTDEYEMISSDKHLSSFDFDYKKRKESIFPEFYLNFLNDIQKENNKVSFKKKVCITLDERLCKDICPNTGRKITAIKIGGVELAYFIYFEIREFFDFVYGDEFTENNISNVENYSSKDIVGKNEYSHNLIDVENTSLDNNKLKLNEEVIAKLFSGNQDIVNNDKNTEYIERIGYVHNINPEKELIFVQDSADGDSGFPIFYRDFPDVKTFSIGTIIRAFGNYYGDKFIVNKYEIGDIDELPFQLMMLEGTLKIYGDSTFAIIRTNLGGVYTELGLIKNYKPDVIHKVKCIAIEAYDKKKQEMGWRAVVVEKIN